jgi:hypothetical protein
MNRSRTALAVTVTGALVVGTLAIASGAASAGPNGGPTIIGTWQMSIDPNGPSAPPPAFRTRIAFSEGGVLTETAGQAPPVNGATIAGTGLGAWEQHGRTVRFVFEKYLFAGSGAVAVQRVEGTAEVSSDGSTQSGPATATFRALDGTVLSTLPVWAEGTRMTP